MEDVKYCKFCDTIKPLTLFVKTKVTKSGYAADCKKCHNEMEKVRKIARGTKNCPGYGKGQHADACSGTCNAIQNRSPACTSEYNRLRRNRANRPCSGMGGLHALTCDGISKGKANFSADCKTMINCIPETHLPQDIIYIMHHSSGWAKIGITTSAPGITISSRVSTHARAGYEIGTYVGAVNAYQVEQGWLELIRRHNVPSAPSHLVPKDGITETFPIDLNSACFQYILDNRIPTPFGVIQP